MNTKPAWLLGLAGLLCLFSASLMASNGLSPSLHARFIGNAGIEITDGESTLLVDFPYQSGAYGYMHYPESELAPRASSLCLFTHIHADHYDAELAGQMKCEVATAADLIAVRESQGSTDTLQPNAAHKNFGAASVHCLPTDHAGIPHCSYLIEWHGLSLLVSGDTESLASVRAAVKALDVAFIAHWLKDESKALFEQYDGVQVVLLHHADGEVIELCEGCVLPQQGESIFGATHGPH